MKVIAMILTTLTNLKFIVPDFAVSVTLKMSAETKHLDAKIWLKIVMNLLSKNIVKEPVRLVNIIISQPIKKKNKNMKTLSI